MSELVGIVKMDTENSHSPRIVLPEAAIRLVQHSSEDPCQQGSWRTLLPQNKKDALQKDTSYSGN